MPTWLPRCRQENRQSMIKSKLIMDFHPSDATCSIVHIRGVDTASGVGGGSRQDFARHINPIGIKGWEPVTKPSPGFSDLPTALHTYVTCVFWGSNHFLESDGEISNGPKLAMLSAVQMSCAMNPNKPGHFCCTKACPCAVSTLSALYHTDCKSPTKFSNKIFLEKVKEIRVG